MTTDLLPEMLWESVDPVVELERRFGFVSSAAVVSWANALVGDAYGLRPLSVDRLVISAQNLMVWVTTADAGRLMIKACRVLEAHDWLAVRGGLVRWLAERGLPVAPPLTDGTGDHQLLHGRLSVGLQPVCPGELLNASDLDQVAAAGETLATLHETLATWPAAATLEHRPAMYPERPSATREWLLHALDQRQISAELDGLLRSRISDLPELPRQPVHHDFRGANLLWDASTRRISAVVDFEEARLDAAIADLAHAVCLLGTWFHDWRPITPAAQDLLVERYAKVRALSDLERAWLPPLVAGQMLGHGWLDDARRWAGR